MRFSYSSCSDFNTCQRKWFYKYLKQIEGIKKVRELENGNYLHLLFQSMFDENENKGNNKDVEDNENKNENKGNNKSVEDNENCGQVVVEENTEENKDIEISPLLQQNKQAIKNRFSLYRKYLFSPQEFLFLGNEVKVGIKEKLSNLYREYVREEVGVEKEDIKSKEVEEVEVEFSGIIDILLYEPKKNIIHIIDIKTSEIKTSHTSYRKNYIKKKYNEHTQLGLYKHIIEKMYLEDNSYLTSLYQKQIDKEENNNNSTFQSVKIQNPTTIWNYLIIFFKEDVDKNKIDIEIDIVTPSSHIEGMKELLITISKIIAVISTLEKETKIKVLNTEGKIREDIKEILHQVENLDEIESRLFPPTITALCNYCSYLSICKEKEPKKFSKFSNAKLEQ